jgi:hypothetical protein
LILLGRKHVAAVHPDRRRPDEAMAFGLLLVGHLDDLHRLGVQAQLAKRGLEIGQRLGVRGASIPPEKFHERHRNRAYRPCNAGPLSWTEKHDLWKPTQE